VGAAVGACFLADLMVGALVDLMVGALVDLMTGALVDLMTGALVDLILFGARSRRALQMHDRGMPLQSHAVAQSASSLQLGGDAHTLTMAATRRKIVILIGDFMVLLEL
jgi:hypothetical protein